MVVPQYIKTMSALIGSTGFVGGHLQNSFDFTQKYHSSNISEIQGLKTDLLICAGLPAEKWKANNDPESDWSNMANLAQMISSVDAEQAILISTIDVYQPAYNVTELDQPNLIGKEGYGRTRAWFESFFAAHFSNSTIVRLPGLFGPALRKNLIYDLMYNREEQYMKVNGNSQFQFFDVSMVGSLIKKLSEVRINLCNVSPEPIFAQEIAEIFGVKLNSTSKLTDYRMKSIHSDLFGGSNGFTHSKINALEKIFNLACQNK